MKLSSTRLRPILAVLVTNCCIVGSIAHNVTFQDDEGVSQAAVPVPHALQRTDNDPTLLEPPALASEDFELGYRMPGFFALNGGEPFYLEKNPVTGAIDFNTRTSPVERKEDSIDAEEYFYEEEEDAGDGIDRKDGVFVDADAGSPNLFNLYKTYPSNINDVNARIVNHKYDTNNKIPLISSSYANTKIQGTGAESNKYNHRLYTTSSTQPPSYYTIRPPHPTYVNPPRTSSSTVQPPQEEPHSHDLDEDTTTLPSPATNDYRTKPEHNVAAQGNFEEKLTQTSPPSKVSESEDYYEDEYDTESGSEFKLSDLFGYGQTSKDDNKNKPKYQESEQQNKHEQNQKYDQSSVASFENVHLNHIRPISENDRTETVPEKTYIEAAQHNQKLVPSTSYQQTQVNQKDDYHSNGESSSTEYQNIKQNYDQVSVVNETKSTKQPLSINKHQHATQERPEHQQVAHPTAATPIENVDQKFVDTNQSTKFATVVVPSSTSSTAPFVGIIYSESAKPNVATSLPLGVHFQYTTQNPQLEMQTKPTAQNEGTHHSLHYSQQFAQQSFKKDHHNSTSLKLPTRPETLDDTSKSVNITASAQFTSGVANNPYGSYAEEPFRPIFGPGNIVIKDTELLHSQQQPLIAPPPIKNPITGTVVDQESPIIPLRHQPPLKIPEETPTRWNYPYRDGSSQYFQLPKQQLQQPPRFSAVQPPTLSAQPVPFLQLPHQNTAGVQDPNTYSQKPTGSSELSIDAGNQDRTTHKPPLAQTNLDWHNKNYEKKVDATNFGDSAVEISKVTVGSGITFSSASDFTNDKTQLEQEHDDHRLEDLEPVRVSAVADQRRPPASARPSSLPTKPNALPYAIPSQDLRPPENPENSRVGSQNYPRPHWEIRPTAPPKFISPPLPPVPQAARPKQDVAAAYFSQMPVHSGHRPRPGVLSPTMLLQGNRMHLKNNLHQDSRLPNILPQFRPNAKISHGHSDIDSRIQADSYFGQPTRQSFLERPGRRPQVELNEHLQPPPPSNYRRVNRNETPVATKDSLDVDEVFPFEKYPPPPPPTMVQQKPLVHRRTGPHFSNNANAHSSVATLQMMQQHQQLLAGNKHYLGRPLAARNEFPDKYDGDLIKPPYHVTYPVGSSLDAESSEKRPVFVVYPVNSSPLTSDSATTDNSAIVMGTRGPNWPVPPSNLASSDEVISEVDSLENNPLALPFIGHKDQKPLLQLPSDRLDTPVLKAQNHVTPVKPIKTDFPYPLEPPGPITNDKYEIDRKYSAAGNKTDAFLNSNTSDKDEENEHKEILPLFGEIPAEVHNSYIDRNEEDDNDTEINIIPYLQDYMPFATKKPFTNIKPVQATTASAVPSVNTNSITVDTTNRPLKPWSSPTYQPYRSSSPISVTLKTVQPLKTTAAASSPNPLETTEHSKPSSWSSTNIGYREEDNHREKISGSEFTVSAVMHTHQSNHRPATEESTTFPPQFNFQAPFLASENIAATPTNKGWSVVASASADKEETRDRVGFSDEPPEDSKAKDDTESGDSSNFDFENFRPQLFGGFKPIYSFPTKDIDERSKFTTEREEKMI